MAESLITPISMDDDFDTDRAKNLVEKKEWMKSCRFSLIQTLGELEAFVDKAIEHGHCAVDLETTGLDSGVRNGKPVNRVVGVCLSINRDEGFYVPIYHTDPGSVNVPSIPCFQQIKRLVENCVTLYANFKFDGEFLRNNGVVLEDWKKVIDVQLQHYVLHAHEKRRGLKHLSFTLLDREMIEIAELFPEKTGRIAFHTLNPRNALVYAASDAINTYALWELFVEEFKERDPRGDNGLSLILEIERKCQIVVMEMERNKVLIDRPYFETLREKVLLEIKDAEEDIYREAGERFEIASPKQLGEMLFVKMGIPYPAGTEKSDSGQWGTADEILEKVKVFPIVKAIRKFRELGKTYGTYIMNFLENSDENNEVKFSLKQASADTGRFSATGGDGIDVDGYCGVNCQNIPANAKDPVKNVCIRKGILAHEGFKLLSIDYSGEELRIAANLSGEPAWIDEFLYGEGDLHSVSAANIYLTTPEEMRKTENKGKRGVGKSANFLTLYGGGPGRLAEIAGVTIDVAMGLLDNFFAGVPVLKKWLESEGRAAMKRGYSRTSFGRRRDLTDFFKDPRDKKMVSAGMRRATNGAIQGCLASEQRVLTSKGYITIGELYGLKGKGDDLRVWTGNNWADFTVLNMGEWDLANITLDNGFVVHCDTRHRVLVEGEAGYEFRMYDDLAIGDKVCVSDPQEVEFGEYPGSVTFSGGSAPNSRDITLDTPEDWDSLAHLAGVVTGDGNIRGKLGIRESVTLAFGRKKLEDLLPKVNTFLEKMGLTPGKPKLSLGSLGESYSIAINSRSLVEALGYVGMNPGEVSRTKRVPDYLFRAPLSMRKAFLKGYWDTDGSKKRVNRYSFHTPNKELLLDVQLLAQTLGLATRLCVTNADTFRLDFCDLTAFETYFGIPVTENPYRAMGKTVAPPWLSKECFEIFHSLVSSSKIHPMYSPQDQALVSKMRHGKPVLVQTLKMMAVKYNVTLPIIYTSYPLKAKEELGRSEVTYSLSVKDEAHQYDAGGVINKNTGADIIKIALYRVWRYIREGGYEDEIKIIMPIHDEIIYEIREDVLKKHIPRLVEVMKLDDLLMGHLKWKVGLDCDAEYGDNMRVEHNFFKELAEEKEGGEKETAEDTKPGEAPKSYDGMGKDPEEKEPVFSEPVKEDGVVLFTNNDTSPFYDYEVKNKDKVARRQSDSIWAILDVMEQHGYSRGPRKRIRLIRDKVVEHKTSQLYSIDGFQAMALFLSI